MNTIKIWNDSPSDRQVADIAQFIKNGMLVVMPTDTMYAIMADALNPKAVERVCKLKRINPDKTNLSIICHDISMAAEYARIDNKGFKLLKENTPGPVTFLFKSASTLAKYLGTPLITTTIEYEDLDHAVNPELIADTYYNLVDLMVEGEDGSTELSTIIDGTDN